MNPLTLYLITVLCALLGPNDAATRAESPAALDPGLLDGFVARSIGPANMGGRITSVAVVEDNPSLMYVGAASGGLWKTINNGPPWTPVFAGQSHISIGDVALAPSNRDIVWVGTGEANPRNSVSWGNGVYKSADGGQTWQQVPVSSPGPDTSFTALTADRTGFTAAGLFGPPGQQDVALWTSANGASWKPSQSSGLNGSEAWQIDALAPSGSGVTGIGTIVTQQSQQTVTFTLPAH